MIVPMWCSCKCMSGQEGCESSGYGEYGSKCRSAEVFRLWSRTAAKADVVEEI